MEKALSERRFAGSAGPIRQSVAEDSQLSGGERIASSESFILIVAARESLSSRRRGAGHPDGQGLMRGGIRRARPSRVEIEYGEIGLRGRANGKPWATG